MSRDDVTRLMQSSKSEDEWNRNCDKVKREFGGYPSWWFEEVIASGLAGRVRSTW